MTKVVIGTGDSEIVIEHGGIDGGVMISCPHREFIENKVLSACNAVMLDFGDALPKASDKPTGET